MGIIVKTHQPWQKCTGNQKRGMCVDSSFHELGCRSAWITETTVRRISFDETRCQGEPVHHPSMKLLISAMLERNVRRRLFRINQAEQ